MAAFSARPTTPPCAIEQETSYRLFANWRNAAAAAMASGSGLSCSTINKVLFPRSTSPSLACLSALRSSRG